MRLLAIIGLATMLTGCYELSTVDSVVFRINKITGSMSVCNVYFCVPVEEKSER